MKKQFFEKNAEGYPDPTASEALTKIIAEEERVSKVVKVVKNVCHLAGFEVEGRIVLRNIKTGKLWK